MKKVTNLKVMLGVILFIALLTPTFGQSPGGVSADLRIWLKADDGFTPASWTDHSGVGNTYTQTNASRQPFVATDQYNFNPVIDFGSDASADGRFMVVPGGGPFSANGLSGTFFTTTLTREGGTSGYRDILGFGATTTGAGLINADIPAVTKLNDDIVLYNSTVSAFPGEYPDNELLLTDVSYTVNVQGIHYGLNGRADSTTQTRTTGGSNQANGSVLGSQPQVTNGLIGEVIAFERDLTPLEKQRIRSYLGIKNGVTLREDIDLAYDYLDAGGNIVWAGTADSIFHNNVFGIANDSPSALHQKQSKSINPNQKLIIGNGASLFDSNAANTNDLADGQFLMVGDNGRRQRLQTPLVYTAGGNGETNFHFEAFWKVQNTGGVGNVTIAWPEGLSNMYLVQSADTTFDNTDNFTPMTNQMTVNGVIYNTATVTLSDGEYFTFAGFAHAPGGVVAGLTQWYRADENIVSGGDSTNVSSWTDFVAGTVSAQINPLAPLPFFRTGSTDYFNFNSGVQFTETDQMIGNITVPTLEELEFDIFTLTKEGMSGTRFFNIGRDNTTFAGSNWDSPGLYVNGNIARRNNGGGLALLDDPGNIDFYTDIPSIMYHTFTDGSVNKAINGNALLPGDEETHGAIGAVLGGHIFGSNANSGTDAPDGDDAGFTGDLGEVIVYGAGQLTAAQRNKVDTYLALKYGLTLENNNDYVNSADSVIWDATANSDFYNNIIGIAHDFYSALQQKQSKSVNPDQQLIIGNGSSLFDNNAANTNNLTDGQFLIVGDNGLEQSLRTPLSYTIGANGPTNFRFEAIWKVQNTGGVGNVTIAWPSGISNMYLVQSADTTFDNTDSFSPMTNQFEVNGVEYSSATVPLNDGEYFTFAGFAHAPGGVVAGMLMWHKADDGVTTAGRKDLWQDISGNGRDVFQPNDTLYEPLLVTDAEYAADEKNYNFNFNPFYYFDGDNDFFYNEDEVYFPSETSEGSTYGVMFNSDEGGFQTPYGWGDDDPNLVRLNDNYYFTRNNGTAIAEDVGASMRPAHITGMNWQGDTDGVYLNLNGQVYANEGTNIGTIQSAVNFAIGSEGAGLTGNGNEVHHGGLPEVFAYSVDHQNSAGDELQRINSYLAIKYGITLTGEDGTGVPSYLSSSSTVVWDSTANETNNNNVFGIAHDFYSDLQQKQSRSANLGQQLIIGNGSSLFDNNAANTNDLTDGQFLIVGDNGLSQKLNTQLIYTAGGNGETNFRFDAIWKAQNTGSVGNVTVAWPVGIENLYLVQSTDSTFDNTDNFTAMTNEVTINGVDYNTATVTLNDGEYFTFAGFQFAPGGVKAAAWYRSDMPSDIYSDAGTTNAEDNNTVQQWNEFLGTGYDLLQDIVANRPTFSDSSTLVNFNPTMSFNGANEMIYDPPAGVNIIDRENGTLYSAGYFNQLGAAAIFGFDVTADYPGLHTSNDAERDKLLFYTGGPGYQGVSDPLFADDKYFIGGANWQNGAGATSAFASSTVSLDGKRNFYNNNELQNAVINDASRDIILGGDFNYGDVDGQVNEAIIFEEALDSNEMDRVESYLSIKFGTTLAMGQKSYVSSNSSVVWDSTANAENNHNIFGIGRDDVSVLNQKQSRSTNQGQKLIIGHGSTLFDKNLDNTNDFGNNFQFLMVGDNGLQQGLSTPLAYTGGANGEVNTRFESIWKAQNTGGVGDVTVAWPAGINNMYLVQSADSTFDNTDNFTPMTNEVTVNGVVYNTATVTISDGEYFTFAGYVNAPAGVFNGIARWYRADRGVTLSTDQVSALTDQVGGVEEITQSDMARMPLYNSEASLVNFNPNMEFTPSPHTALNSLTAGFAPGTSGIETFSVATPNSATLAQRKYILGITNVSQTGAGANENDRRFAVGNVLCGNGTMPQIGEFRNCDVYATTGMWTAGVPSIIKAGSSPAPDNDQFFISQDGSLDVTGPGLQSMNYVETGFGLGSGGDNVENNAVYGWDGQISEVILYGGGLSETERRRVDSYLALKYGITLARVDTSHYLASTESDTSIVWDGGENTVYNNNIFGIARSDVGDFEQKVSMSINSGAILTVAKDNDFESSNLDSSRTSLETDESYLIFGDNDDLSTTPNEPAEIGDCGELLFTETGIKLIPREWLVQRTNMVGGTYLQADLTSYAGEINSNVTMFVADDEDFTDNVVMIPGVQQSSGNWVFSYNFDGDNENRYVTFGGTYEAAPCEQCIGSTYTLRTGHEWNDNDTPWENQINNEKLNVLIGTDAEGDSLYANMYADYSADPTIEYWPERNPRRYGGRWTRARRYDNTSLMSSHSIGLSQPMKASFQVSNINTYLGNKNNFEVVGYCNGTLVIPELTYAYNTSYHTFEIDGNTAEATLSWRGFTPNVSTANVRFDRAVDSIVIISSVDRVNTRNTLRSVLYSDITLECAEILEPTPDNVYVSHSFTQNTLATCGGETTMRIKVTNNNICEDKTIDLHQVLPAGLEYVPGSFNGTQLPGGGVGGATLNYSGSNFDLTNLTLPQGEHWMYIDVANPEVAGTYPTDFTFEVTNGVDPMNTYESSVVDLNYYEGAPVPPTPTLTHSIKEVEDGSITCGQNNMVITYRMEIENNHTSAITGAEIYQAFDYDQVIDSVIFVTGEDEDGVVTGTYPPDGNAMPIEPEGEAVFNLVDATIPMGVSYIDVVVNVGNSYDMQEVDSLGLSATFLVGVDSNGECAESDESRSNEVILPACEDGPIAVNDTVQTNADTPLDIAVLENDIPGVSTIDTSSVAVTEIPANGSTLVNPDGTIEYTPDMGFVGTDSLVYEVCDSASFCDTAFVLITVLPAQDTLPETITPMDMPVVVCADTAGVPGTVASVTSCTPMNGSVAEDGLTGCIEYTPGPGYIGTDTTCIIVCDEDGICDTTLVPIVVLPPQDTLPEISTPSDSTIIVCADTTMVPGMVSSVEACDPMNGTAVADALTGCIEYTPDMGYIGTDTTCIVVCDENGICDTTLVPIVVLPPKDTLPEVSTPMDSTVVICADTTGLPGTVASVESCDPENGTAAVDGLTGCIEYTPDMGYTGTDTTCIIVCDDLGNCDTTIVPVIIYPPQDTIEDVSVPQDSTVVICADTTGLPGTVASVESCDPENGTAAVDGLTGCIEYTPDMGYTGTDTTCIIVCDDLGNCDTTIVPVIIYPPQDTIEDVSVPQDSTVVICADTTGLPGTVASVESCDPENGTAAVDGLTGCIEYTPDMGYTGTDTTCIIVCDDLGNCDTTIVPIIVYPPQDTLDDVSVPQDSTVVICADTTGLPGTVASVESCDPENGTAAVDGLTGCIEYTPDMGYTGTDTTCIIVCDDLGNCDTTIVPVIIYPPQDTIEDVSVPQDSTVVICADTTGLPGTVASVESCDPENGTAAVDGLTGCIEYTPDMGYTGTDTTCIIVCDDLGNCDTTIVPIIVYPPQDTLDDVSVPQDSTVVICADTTGLPGTVASVESCDPENGTAAVDGLTGCIEYTPDMGYTGTDTTCIIVCDDLGNCDTTIVPIIVYPPQDTLDDVSVPQDSTVVICADTTGLPGTVASVESCDPENGTAAVDGLTGCIEYTPDMGYTGTDTTCIIVCDDLGNCDTTIVPVIIYPPQDTIEDVSVPQDSTVVICADTTGLPGTVASVESCDPENGTAAVDGLTGCIEYTPDMGYTGTDTTCIIVCDDLGNCDTTIVPVIIYPPQDTIEDVSVPQDSTVVICADTTGLPGTVASVESCDPENGTAAVDGLTGCIEYTPDMGYTGTDTTCIIVCDDLGNCDTTIVPIIVYPPQDTLDDVSVPQDSTVVICADTTGLPGTVASVESCDPENGTAAVDGLTGCIEYTPDMGYTGTDTTCIIVCDDLGNCDTTIVPVIIYPPQDTIEDVSVPQDSTVVICADTTGLPGTVASVESCDPENGTAAVDGLTGCIEYTPDMGYTGTDTTCIIVCDDLGNCDTTIVPIIVYPPQDTIEDVSVPQDSTVVICADTTGLPGTVASVESCDPENGTAAVDGLTGCIEYTPDMGYTGTDTTCIIVCDDLGNCDTTIVPVIIYPPQDTIEDVSVPQDSTVVICADTTGLPGTVASVESCDPENGTAAVDGLTGCIEYTPDMGYTGTDTTCIIVCDDLGNCDTTIVPVIVYPPQDTIEDVTVPQDSTVVICADTTGLPGTVASVESCDPENGTAAVDGLTGCIEYTPDMGYTGTDTTCIIVCDDLGNCDTTIVPVIIYPPQDTIEDVTVPQDSTVVICADTTGLPGTVASVESCDPENGTAAVDGLTGCIEYTPDMGYAGTDTTCIIVCDDLGNCDTTIIPILIEDIPLVANDDMESTSVNTPVEVAVLDNDTGPIDSTSVVVLDPPSNGMASVNPDGTITYTPDMGFVGNDTLTYVIDNIAGDASDTALVVIEVMEEVEPGPFSCRSFISPAVLEGGMLQVTVGDLAVSNGENVYRVQVFNEWGAELWSGENLSNFDYILEDIDVCDYLGSTLTVRITNRFGSCESNLILDDTVSPILTSAFGTTMDEASDLGIPTARIDTGLLVTYCGYVPAPEDHEPSLTIPCSSLNTRSSSRAYSVKAQPDWVEVVPCNEESDTSEVIYRTWEVLNKDGDLFTLTDTIVVLRLPMLTAESFVGYMEDTTFCEIEPLEEEGESVKRYAAWKQPLGIHDYEEAYSKLGGVVYELPLTIVGAGLLNAESQGEEVLEEYLECVIVKKLDGTEITIGDIVSGDYMDDLLSNASSTQLSYGFLHAIYELGEDPVSVIGGAFTFFPYLLLEQGDWVLSENGFYEQVTEDWFYNGNANSPYWFAGAWPSIYGSGDCIRYCDAATGEFGNCAVRMLVPELGEGDGEEGCVEICLDELDGNPHCGISIATESQEWTGSCPATKGQDITVTQTCWANGPGQGAGGVTENECVWEGYDETTTLVDLEASDFESDKRKVAVLSQWLTLIDTIGPIFDFCYPEGTIFDGPNGGIDVIGNAELLDGCEENECGDFQWYHATEAEYEDNDNVWPEGSIQASIVAGEQYPSAQGWEQCNPTVYTTGSHDCAADVYVPSVTLKDDCSGVHHVKAMVNGRAVELDRVSEANGFVTFAHTEDPIRIPFQGHGNPMEVRYEAADSCWNVSEWYKYIEVKDATPPTIAVDDEVRVSLTNKVAWVEAEEFDEGSWDNCGISLRLARRVDWWADTACVDLCSSGKSYDNWVDLLVDVGFSRGEVEAILDGDVYCGDYDYDIEKLHEFFLEHEEVEAHYYEKLKWLWEDGQECGPMVVHGWLYDIARYVAENCGPEVSGDEHGNPLDLEDLEGFFDRLVGVAGYGKEIAYLGGGWSKAVPFKCEDACEEPMVELLVMDYWCNWGKAWVLVDVEDKSQAEVSKELEDITISCEAYNLFYKDIVEEAAGYNAAGGSIADTSDAYAALDEAFGRYIKTWVNNQGQPTDIEGNVLPDSILQFYYSTVVCEEKSITEKVADTLHDGRIDWITEVTKESYLDTIREQGYHGVIAVNCSATCEQDVWIDLDDCGYGTITRRFFIQGGCGPHGTPPQEVEQVIYVEPACDVRLSMFDVPEDVGTKTEALCVASEDMVYNLPTSLTGNATLLPHLEGALCNAVAIGHEDKVSRILDASGMYKVERTWDFVDWCDQNSRIAYVQEIIVQVDPECTEPDVVSRGPDPMDDFEVGNREIGDGFKLHQNRPNPFDGYTVISFDLPEDTDARLTIYDVTGKVLKEFEGEYVKGYNEVQVAQHELPVTGVMYYQLDTEKFTATKRMVKVE